MLMLLFLACSASYESDMRVWCDAPTASGMTKADPAVKWMVLASYLSKHLSNGEVLALMKQGKSLPEKDRAAFLREKAAKVGITKCQLADVLELQP